MNDIHTMPTDGKHIESKDCFCCPQLVYEDEFTGIKQWLHNDTREGALQ
jgi:hypothetical protein